MCGNVSVTKVKVDGLDRPSICNAENPSAERGIGHTRRYVWVERLTAIADVRSGIQFSIGFCALSMTSTSAGPLVDFNFSPSCSMAEVTDTFVRVLSLLLFVEHGPARG